MTIGLPRGKAGSPQDMGETEVGRIQCGEDADIRGDAGIRKDADIRAFANLMIGSQFRKSWMAWISEVVVVRVYGLEECRNGSQAGAAALSVRDSGGRSP
jgi:hypothetical protein